MVMTRRAGAPAKQATKPVPTKPPTKAKTRSIAAVDEATDDDLPAVGVVDNEDDELPALDAAALDPEPEEPEPEEEVHAEPEPLVRGKTSKTNTYLLRTSNMREDTDTGKKDEKGRPIVESVLKRPGQRIVIRDKQEASRLVAEGVIRPV
jgi:hypothetical protein